MRMEGDGVAVVTIDVPDEKMNTLCAKMTDDFAITLDKIEGDDSIKSVVLISGKPDNFIAGADIKQLSACKSEAELEALSTMGQKFMDRMSDNKRPFVAAIHGACLGGGLEVALACDYRIATEHKKTSMALPEVMLGLLPGAGGTQRLPKLVGLQKALPMVLTGKTIRPKQAKSMGLVDGLCDPFALEAAAIQAAEGLADGSMKAKRKDKGLFNKLLEDNGVGQAIVFNQATKMVDKNTNGKYPAPYKILDAVKAGLSSGHAAGSKVEAKGFSELGMTSESKALVSIFFGQTACKKNPYGKPEKGKEVNTVAVIGAGLMGAGIAQVSAMKGFDVLLKDMSAVDVNRGEGAIRSALQKRVKKRAMTAHELDIITSKVVPLIESDPNWPKHMANADLVVEAVPEIMALKHKIIKQMEEHISPNCIIATNTSALPIEEIASASARPENVIGMHYFSPVPQMPLLEIITHPGTSNETASKAVDVGVRQGKTCIVVKDVPGFYVNRCLGPFLAESMSIIEAGTSLESLDKAMKDFGLPVGPITLADEVGVDVANHVGVFLREHLGTRMLGSDPAAMQEMVDKGFLGRKSKPDGSGATKGFYMYPPGKSKGKKQLNPEAVTLMAKFKKEDLKLSTEDVQQRMICRFVNEAVLCLEDGIISSATDGDIGAVFGMGFPPFIGGPFRYVDAVGADKFVAMMEGYAEKYGAQFTPCALLKQHAAEGKRFHPLTE